jgi:hypothetical protein
LKLADHPDKHIQKRRRKGWELIEEKFLVGP